MHKAFTLMTAHMTCTDENSAASDTGDAFGTLVESTSLLSEASHVITQEGVDTMVSQSNEATEIVRTFARLQAVKVTRTADEDMEKGQFITIHTPPAEPEIGALG
ncbi:hypothetical protein [Dyella acidiphila]|uniref:Uncharacterized protein n=1 Tax=Dyella acidiphila TaxID=2775866 RepID=A0ABR9G4P4_9GAMM|nr:hypothetical protein [Dyella acidiphila]MBE1158982.1 hypothetical protein [Dyella acidiphila]